jgi:DNA-nicking Smr family endonuclease
MHRPPSGGEERAMARRRRPSRAGAASGSKFHTPLAALRDLARTVRRTPVARPHAAPPATGVAARGGGKDADDAASFAEAMRDVVPLPAAARGRIEGPAPAGAVLRAPVTDDAEALAVLGDLVAGNGTFDISDTDEYVEGHAVGLDPRIVRRLRAGDFAWHGHLDLHGLTSDEARRAIERFLSGAHRRGIRCVLIIHGRGRNSKDQIPVLKERLKVWLGHGPFSKFVLAFTTARACDGGAGAVYVLLRRRRRRVPFVVTGGAKR